MVDAGVVDGEAGIAVVAWSALLTVLALRVVQTLVTDAAADPARRLVHGRVEVTARRVTVTLALCKPHKSHHVTPVLEFSRHVVTHLCAASQHQCRYQRSSPRYTCTCRGPRKK